MKKLSLSLTLVAAFTATALAKSGEVTLTGEGKCLKCALKKADKCQNVLEVKEKDSDKVTLYILTGDISGKFHGEICSKTEKVEVTGVESEKDGKKSIEVSKIAKQK